MDATNTWLRNRRPRGCRSGGKSAISWIGASDGNSSLVSGVRGRRLNANIGKLIVGAVTAPTVKKRIVATEVLCDVTANPARNGTEGRCDA